MVMLSYDCAIAWSFCVWWRSRMAVLVMVCHPMAVLFIVVVSHGRVILWWCYFMVMMSYDCAIAWSFCLWWRCEMSILVMVCYLMAVLIMVVLMYDGYILYSYYRIILLFYGDAIVW
jgi:hypothetical protein